MQKTWLLFHHIPNKWGLLQIQIWKMNSRKWDNIYSKGNKLDFLSYKKTDENSLACHSFVRLLNFFCLFFLNNWSWKKPIFSCLIFSQNSQFEPITLHSTQLPCVLCARALEAKRSRKRYLCKIDLSDFQHGCNWSWHIAQCLQLFFKSQVNHVEELCTQVHTCVNWGSWHNIRNSYHKIDYIDFRSRKLSRKRTFKKSLKIFEEFGLFSIRSTILPNFDCCYAGVHVNFDWVCVHLLILSL